MGVDIIFDYYIDYWLTEIILKLMLILFDSSEENGSCFS